MWLQGLTTNKKLKQDQCAQDAYRVQTISVFFYDTVKGYTLTLMRYIGGKHVPSLHPTQYLR